MVSLEQIKLLESKIARVINFVTQVTEENGRLKKRNKELEELSSKLQEEKAKVDEGIVSALGILDQFEDAIERSLSKVKESQKLPQSHTENQEPASAAAPATVATVASAELSPPVLPSAYSVDEEPETLTVEEDSEEPEDSEDPEGTELDIF
ncbi:MAG: hypothetical protein LBH07_03685 [Treponema sp.]|jgi:myosin heavy subunit|nr:hypothetical protein [Treponema sp.]